MVTSNRSIVRRIIGLRGNFSGPGLGAGYRLNRELGRGRMTQRSTTGDGGAAIVSRFSPSDDC